MDLNELVSKMTLEEKAGLCSGLNFWETKPVDRLGVPSIMMTDGPHGLRKVVFDDGKGKSKTNEATCFPPAVLSACSFDRELLGELGEAIGDEAVAENVSIVLGPGVNIKRSPLCGRNFEYFSEDPYLAGEMATAFIKGVQSRGVGTSLKHFAANNQETRRWSSDSVIDERTLREIYLPAFKKAVEEAQPATVMCSYNRLNGEYASESARLLTQILREEWGFEGIVISDWGAVNKRVKGLAAGLDLEMPGAAVPSNDEQIVRAVQSGELDEAVLDTTVLRLLKTIFKCKLDSNDTAVDIEKHDALARKIAAQSMVLLKNDGDLLPLGKNTKIAVIGEMAAKPRYQGAGSSQVCAYKVTSALDAMRELAGAQADKTITYAKGYKTSDCDAVDISLQDEAVAAAKGADVCVVFIGLPPHYESEGYDRDHMRMPGGLNELVKAVCSANPKTVVVLSNGAPVEMPWLSDVPAVLEAYLGGQAGGGAVADILFGSVNPSGRLAETMPLKLSDNPSYLYYIGERDVTQYREGVFVGYRYYETKETEVAFPFGHGLSYTTFEYSNLKLDKTNMRDTDTLRVTVDVKNTGSRKGKEVVQLYVGAAQKDDRLIRPVRELRDFTKIELGAGESRQVSFTLDKSAFSYYNTTIEDFHVLGGDYFVCLGKSSRDIILQSTVRVEQTVRIPGKADINTTVRDIRRMPRGWEFLRAFAKRFPVTDVIAREEVSPDDPDYGHVRSGPEMVLRQMRLMGFMKDITDEEIQSMMDEYLN